MLIVAMAGWSRASSLMHDMELVELKVVVFVKPRAGEIVEAQTSEGKLFLSMLGAFAEFERTLIRERVVAGLVAARGRGHKGGRRPKLSAAQHRQVQMLKQGGMSMTEIAQTLQCRRHTEYKALGQESVVPQQAS